MAQVVNLDALIPREDFLVSEGLTQPTKPTYKEPGLRYDRKRQLRTGLWTSYWKNQSSVMSQK